MSEFKEAKDNPLHKDYGIFKNTKFILDRAMKYCPAVLPLSIVCMVFGSLQGYFWGIMSKFVIDVISTDIPTEEKIHNLIITIAIILPSALIIYATNTFAGSKLWPRYIKIRMGVIHEREEKVMHMNYELLESPEALDIHQRAKRATGGNQEGIEGMFHILESMGRNFVTVIVAFVAVTVLEWRLILVLFVMVILSFLYYKWTIKRDKKEVWDKLAPVWRQVSYMSRVSQHFDYAKDVRLFSMRDFLLGKQRKVYEKREERYDKHYLMWQNYSLFGQVLNIITRTLIYSVLFFAVMDKFSPMSIGNFTLYLSLAMAFSSALLVLLQQFGDYSRASMEVDDLRSFLDIPDENDDALLDVQNCKEYEICFHNVSYRYPNSDRYAVKNLNITLVPGERLAVVGLNGAGKTTMIKLLLRLYDPTEGYISLNGTDIRKFKRKDYYKLFSPVFQKVELFATSFSENISLRPENNTDRIKAHDCIELAGLEDKFLKLGNGFDTQILKVVSDDGIDLSGGEKQRLALARALYKGAPIVVLDEPTAALDALAEKQLYENFDSMIGTKSAVYISHRLASTRFCNHIAMFSDGVMCEYGTHNELMEKNGKYASMFEVQSQYYKDHPEEEVIA